MTQKIKGAQIKLLQADMENYIIYQLDETIFDARQRVRYSWSAKREHLEVPKTTSKLNQKENRGSTLPLTKISS
jgi:hypothetical protein